MVILIIIIITKRGSEKSFKQLQPLIILIFESPSS